MPYIKLPITELKTNTTMKLSQFLKTTLLLSGLTLGMSLHSCKKKSTEPEPTPVVVGTFPDGTIKLHFHTNVDTIEVDAYDTVYTMANGRKIAVDLAQLYVSNIQLVKENDSLYDLSGTKILKLMQIEEYLAGGAHPGNYKSIRFNVGLAPATNSTTPFANDSTLNKPIMWFGTTVQPDGYVFVNFNGKIDTSNAANNTVAQMQPFSYKIGTNANVKNVSMPVQNYMVVSSNVTYIHIVIDYNKLFTGIQLNNPANLIMNTASANGNSLATQLANNIPSMFRYEF